MPVASVASRVGRAQRAVALADTDKAKVRFPSLPPRPASPGSAVQVFRGHQKGCNFSQVPPTRCTPRALDTNGYTGHACGVGMCDN
ncbi:hypothetical protein BaRGS_00011917 [Batillaria attramentaria]|uniref:Uncharacterized protein n=1 Tax=Batillaria attramentaria TaxID=370345 RepID=A0ABD0LBK4_9CAEN